MNGYLKKTELPPVNDNQIYLLDLICKGASKLVDSPFQALSREYEVQLQNGNAKWSEGNDIFKWLFRVADSARHTYRDGRPTNLVPHLRALLETHGITIYDDTEEGEIDGVTRSLDGQPSPARPPPESARKRRVSFDDARLEETWLSERSRFAHDLPDEVSRDFLRQPPRRPGQFASRQRARSASPNRSEQQYGIPQPAPKHFQRPSQSSEYTSDNQDEEQDERAYVEPSYTQMEFNAVTFRETTFMQYQRSALHRMHDIAVQHHRDHEIALAHDDGIILRQMFRFLRTFARQRQEEREYSDRLDQMCAEFQGRKDQHTLQRAFTQWYQSVLYNRSAIELVKRIVIARKYFRRWRDITEENIIKSRSILLRRYLRIWQLKTARKALNDELHVAQWEEFLMRKYLRKWRLKCRSRQAEPWQETLVERRTLATLVNTLRQRRHQEVQADQFRLRCLTRGALEQLWATCQTRDLSVQSAQDHCGLHLKARYLGILRMEAKLRPLAMTFTLSLELKLKQKAIRVWHLHLKLSRQAAEVDRKRVLQSAWTNWNDALRCKALGQRIDERVLLESLSKWVLQTRLQSFQRRRNERICRGTLSTWRERAQQTVSTLDQAEAVFAEYQVRRRLRHGMLRLNIAIRSREDAERAAVEFSNGRALPDVIDVWRQRTDHVRQITKWARDARFYYLTTRTLKAWQEKATEHQHNRRRQAYAHVRARVKIRIVRECFTRLQIKTTELSTMKQDAAVRYQARLFRVGTESFDKWRETTAQHIDLDTQAKSMDQQKLLTSAFAAVVNHHADIVAMHQQALLLRQDSDLVLQASALRKVQWATFTATRRVETADALWARNRDLHMKQMLRHWALQAIKFKSDKSKATQQDAESPSLRPASRLASRSADRPTFTSSPPIQSATPGYTRTPSRTRRGGRFRPLPTPAHVTPMAFDRAYLVTTPAPLTNAGAGQRGEEAGDAGDVFEGRTPQITPFARKLRAGGILAVPPSALKSSIFGRSVAVGGGGTNKSVRFAGSSRFGSSQRRLNSADQ